MRKLGARRQRAGRESVVDVVKELAYEIGDCLQNDGKQQSSSQPGVDVSRGSHQGASRGQVCTSCVFRYHDLDELGWILAQLVFLFCQLLFLSPCVSLPSSCLACKSAMCFHYSYREHVCRDFSVSVSCLSSLRFEICQSVIVPISSHTSSFLSSFVLVELVRMV